ncbi:hypothetical protein [Candidatus Thiosymbion oneisti]|uniref:hypothetical protein n=1 Tax=Candidatus Thiosymbion oneisti TaxID=589554 RepID=UPI000B7CF8E5|nr:hypothetical protein [Candidatus Thiosymbion oneisti]
MKQIIAVISGIFLIASLSYASTPEELSKSYFDFMKEDQWDKLVELYDPSALRDMREMLSFFSEVPDEMAPQMLAQFFGPGMTKATLKTMSDTDFFSSFFKGVMAQAEQLGQLEFKQVDILGTVPEGENLRHVLARTHAKLGDMTMETMEVVSFKKTEGGWKILMQGKIKGMAQQLKKMFSRG